MKSGYLLVALFIGILAGVPRCGAGSLVPQIDQQNWPPSQYNLNGTLGVEQEFTPQLNALNTVGLWAPPAGIVNPINQSGFTALMNIRQGGVGGPIIASSEPAYGPPSGGSIVFTFKEPVGLTPGQLYAFEPLFENGGSFFAWGLPVYPGGRLYFAGGFGSGFAGGSIAFIEGINVPEPSASLLFLMGVLALLIRTKTAAN